MRLGLGLGVLGLGCDVGRWMCCRQDVVVMWRKGVGQGQVGWTYGLRQLSWPASTA